jgi:hypothetical protein
MQSLIRDLLHEQTEVEPSYALLVVCYYLLHPILTVVKRRRRMIMRELLQNLLLSLVNVREQAIEALVGIVSKRESQLICMLQIGIRAEGKTSDFTQAVVAKVIRQRKTDVIVLCNVANLRIEVVHRECV